MSLNIELRLPSEYIEALQHHVAASGGDIDSYVTEIVADNLQGEVEAARKQRPGQDTFADWLQQWANRHPRIDHEIDISRESIYAGCGE